MVWNNLAVIPAASTAHDWFLLACAAGTVLLLLFLIARVRLHPALALAASALALGVASGMPLTQVPLSFSAGVGNLMGHIAIVLAMGAILGRLLAGSGGATALGKALVESCGTNGLPWALLALGMLVGMPVFFEVGLVLLMPIVAEAARRSGRPAILVGMPGARRSIHGARHAPAPSRGDACGYAISRRPGPDNPLGSCCRIARRRLGRSGIGMVSPAPLEP